MGCNAPEQSGKAEALEAPRSECATCLRSRSKCGLAGDEADLKTFQEAKQGKKRWWGSSDTSVLLAAAESATGASLCLILEAASHGGEPLSADYRGAETRHNLPKLGQSAAARSLSDFGLQSQ